MFASKMFDPVLGVDIHIIITPAGVPIPMPHPFVGLVFDWMAWLPFIGTTVYVNGVPGAAAGTEGRTVPGLHFPIGGVFAVPPGNECEIFMGSSTVLLQDDPFSRMTMPVLSCSTVGIPPPFRKSKKKGMGLFLPTSVVVSVPFGQPVAIGGPPTINAMALGMRAGMALGGIIFKRFIQPSKAYKKVCQKVHDAASTVTRHLPKKARNRVHRSLCDAIGHPVDVGTGKVFTERNDFSLPGPLPLDWRRVWYSTSDYAGPLGHGWHHSYDIQLGLADNATLLELQLPDGREAFLPPLLVGETVYLKQEQLTLVRHADRYELTDENYVVHEFSDAKSLTPPSLLGATTPPVEATQNFQLPIGDRVPVRRIHRAGAEIVFDYDDDFVLRRIVDSAGRELTVDRDDDGRITAIHAPHPAPSRVGETVALVRYAYDAVGNLVRDTDALGNSYRFQYKGHLLVRETNRRGFSFHFAYDGEDEDAWCTRTWGDGGIHDNTILYDKKRRVSYVTNSLGHRTKYYYNEDGLVWKTVDPLGGEFIRQYDQACNLVQTIDEENHVTKLGYDGLGHLVEVTYPDGSQIKLTNKEHELVAAVDQNGAAFSWAYNAAHQLTRKVGPTGEQTTYEYAGPYLTAVVDKRRRRTELSYDEAGNLTAVTNADGGRSRYRHDRWGRQTWRRDEAGVAGRKLNLLGYPVKLNDPDGNVTQLTYDAEENLIGARNRYTEVRFEYKGYNKLGARTQGAAGKLVEPSVENPPGTGTQVGRRDQPIYRDRNGHPWGQRVEFQYDTQEQLTGIINEHGYAYRYEHDARGEVVADSSFGDVRRAFLRDRAGRVTELVRPGGERIRFELNARGRTTRIHDAHGTDIRLSYRAGGELMRADNGASVVRYERDILGRITAEYRTDRAGGWTGGQEELAETPPGAPTYVIRSTYDRFGDRTRIVSNLGARVALERDEQGMVTRITNHAAATNNHNDGDWSASFERDFRGLEINRSLPGGVSNSWERDALGRPRRQRISIVGGEAKGLYGQPTQRTRVRNYDWGPMGRLNHISDTGRGRIDFDYDPVGFLTKAAYPDGKEVLRLPDAMGNLFRSADRSDREYGPAGQLLRDGAVRYIYDAAGNLVEKDNVQTGERWGYAWNGIGLLTQVKQADGRTVDFTYDALSRRTSKTYAGETTRWVWDGNVMLHEWREQRAHTEGKQPQEVLNGPGGERRSRPFNPRAASTSAPNYPSEADITAEKLTAAVAGDLTTWLYEPGSVTPLAKFTPHDSYSIISDHLGTPLTMYDQEGNQKADLDLDAYGEVKRLEGWKGGLTVSLPRAVPRRRDGTVLQSVSVLRPGDGFVHQYGPHPIIGGQPDFVRVRSGRERGNGPLRP